jgi:hypothetical protein
VRNRAELAARVSELERVELTDDRRYHRSLASSADLLLHSKERNVAMLVVLRDDPTGEFSLRQDLVTSLAQLGVTNAALVRDEQTDSHER